MEQEQTALTEYDGLIQTRELQMLKTMLPFVSVQHQMPLAILIQSMEFKNTIQMFQNNANALTACALPKDSDKKSAMIQSLKRFCTPKERETLDNIMNIMYIMENYESFK